MKRVALLAMTISGFAVACTEPPTTSTLSSGSATQAPLPVSASADAKSAPTETPSSRCLTVPLRSDALDAPEKHAWDLFLALNHPAKPLSAGRGIPDCAKDFGAPGNTSVWETWRLARTEVFLPDGSEPPAWDDTSIPGAQFGATPDALPSPHNPPSGDPKLLATRLRSEFGIDQKFDDDPDQGVFKDHGGIGETHVNKATYDFIKENCLWSFDGLSRYSAAVIDKKKPALNFPVESIEVKAVWVEFTPEEVKAGKPRTYYVAKANSKTYGLVSFHVLTKDVPNWFWATFHHSDNPHNPDEQPSAFPRPKQLDNTVWANYVLGGTQTDFVTSTGQETVLSDAYIEFDFTRSSCITCHASAHGHPAPARDASGKLSRDSKGRILASREGPLQTIDLGVPKKDSFLKEGKPFFPQTDFVWSIPFRAQEEKAAPPARCKF